VDHPEKANIPVPIHLWKTTIAEALLAIPYMLPIWLYPLSLQTILSTLILRSSPLRSPSQVLINLIKASWNSLWTDSQFFTLMWLREMELSISSTNSLNLNIVTTARKNKRTVRTIYIMRTTRWADGKIGKIGKSGYHSGLWRIDQTTASCEMPGRFIFFVCVCGNRRYFPPCKINYEHHHENNNMSSTLSSASELSLCFRTARCSLSTRSRLALPTRRLWIRVFWCASHSRPSSIIKGWSLLTVQTEQIILRLAWSTETGLFRTITISILLDSELTGWNDELYRFWIDAKHLPSDIWEGEWIGKVVTIQKILESQHRLQLRREIENLLPWLIWTAGFLTFNIHLSPNSASETFVSYESKMSNAVLTSRI